MHTIVIALLLLYGLFGRGGEGRGAKVLHTDTDIHTDPPSTKRVLEELSLLRTLMFRALYEVIFTYVKATFAPKFYNFWVSRNLAKFRTRVGC